MESLLSGQQYGYFYNKSRGDMTEHKIRYRRNRSGIKGRLNRFSRRGDSGSDIRKSENMDFFLKVVADIEINRSEEEKEAIRNHLRKNGYRSVFEDKKDHL